MPTHYIAFLRGINLGNRRIKMERLKELFSELRFKEVETFIASGNVIFEASEADSRKLEDRIKKHLQGRLGYEVDTFVRSRSEVAAVAAYLPFSKAEHADERNTLVAGFLAEALSPAQAKAFVACGTEIDLFQVRGREFYWLCRGSIGESKIWNSPAVKALKLPSATMRNLTTLRKLAALYPPVR